MSLGKDRSREGDAAAVFQLIDTYPKSSAKPLSDSGGMRVVERKSGLTCQHHFPSLAAQVPALERLKLQRKAARLFRSGVKPAAARCS